MLVTMSQLHGLPIVEMQKSTENPNLAREAALLSMQLRGKDYRPEAWEIRERVTHIDSMVTVVATDGEEVAAIGTLGIPEPPTTSGEINILVVALGYRGAGLGRDIIALLEEKAQEKGLQKIQVQSSYEAKDFYRHLGYRLIAGADFVKTL